MSYKMRTTHPSKKLPSFWVSRKPTAKITPSCYKRKILVGFSLSNSSSNVAKFGHQVTDRDLEIIFLR